MTSGNLPLLGQLRGRPNQEIEEIFVQARKDRAAVGRVYGDEDQHFVFGIEEDL